MHHRSHPFLHVALRPSRIGGAVAIVLHALAVIAALDAPDPWLAAGLLGLVLLSARSSARHWRGGGANGVRAVGRDGAGNWWLETCAGERVAVSLAGATLVTRPLVALSFRADDRRWDVALLADSAAPDELRRLRAALRTAA